MYERKLLFKLFIGKLRVTNHYISHVIKNIGNLICLFNKSLRLHCLYTTFVADRRE